MDLHGRQCQLFRDVRVLDVQRLIDRLAFDPFSHQRARRDGRTTTISLELRVFDDAVLADFDLQLHHIATSGCTHHTRAHKGVALVHRTHVTGILIVI